MELKVSIKFGRLTHLELILCLNSLLFKISKFVLIVRLNMLDHLVLIKIAYLIFISFSHYIFHLQFIFWKVNHVILRSVIVAKVSRIYEAITGYLLKLSISFVDVSQIFDHVDWTDENIIFINVGRMRWSFFRIFRGSLVIFCFSLC